MQNVPSPQEIFLPHTHNPTTSYLHNVVISIAHMRLICHQKEAQPEVGARDRELGGPDLCPWHTVGSWLRFSSLQKRS